MKVSFLIVVALVLGFTVLYVLNFISFVQTGALSKVSFPSLLPAWNDFCRNLLWMIHGGENGYSRALKASFSFAMMSLFFLSAGKWLVRGISKKFNPEETDMNSISVPEKFGLYFLTGSLSASLIWMLLGSLEWLNASVATGLEIAGALFFYFQFIRNHDLKELRKKIIRHLQAFEAAEIILLIFAVTFILMSAAAAMKDQSFGDTLITHLALPNYYIQNGAMTAFPNHIHSYFSQNSEMLTLWSMLLNSEPSAGLLIWGFSIALMASLYGFFFRRNSGLAALLAVVLFFTANYFVWFSFTVKSDIPMAAFLVAHYLALIEAIDKTEKNSQGHFWMLIAGLLAGGAMGHKYAAFPAVLISTGMIVGFDFLDGINHKKIPKKTIYFLLGAALAFAPWIIRTHAITGNPIYPYFQNYFADPLIRDWHSGIRQIDSISNKGWGILFSYAKSLLMRSGSDSTHWGPMILFALLTPICFSRKFSLGIRAVLASALLSWAFSICFSLILRYHMALIIMATTIPFVAVFDYLQNKKLTGKIFKYAISSVVFLSALSLAVCSSVIVHLWTHTRILLSGHSPGNYYQSGAVHLDELRWMTSMINSNTGEDAVVLIAGYGANVGLKRKFLFSCDTDKHVFIELAEKAGDPEELFEMLKARKVSEIIFSPDFDPLFINNFMRPDLTASQETKDKISRLVASHLRLRLVSPSGWWRWYAVADGGNSGERPPMHLQDDTVLRYPAVSLDYARRLLSSDQENAKTILHQITRMPVATSIQSAANELLTKPF